MIKITYWDVKVGDFIKAGGRAQNAYEVTSKSEKKICMKRVRDGMEHCMETGRMLDMLNREADLNMHLCKDRK